MGNQSRESTSVQGILQAISDEKSLELFKTIAETGGKSDQILKKLNLSHKEHYSRISNLLKRGLVRKKEGKFTLTALGIIVYETHLLLANAVNNYWKLKIIDSISPLNGISTNELKRLIDTLIDNVEIKTMLTSLVIVE
jgi:predicted transcriptional regulator